MKERIRRLLWRILGIDYDLVRSKLDYVLLKSDKLASIGKGSYDNGAKVWRWTDAPLIIGNYCCIAHNVNFIIDEGFHNSSEITSYPFINDLTDDIGLVKIRENLKQKTGIVIGNDVWIGMGVYIMPGIRIGNGVTIAANTVVTYDIPDYSVVGGVPGRIIRKKIDDISIRQLNSIAWWDWDESLILERIPDFYLPSNDFINKYSKSVVSI